MELADILQTLLILGLGGFLFWQSRQPKDQSTHLEAELKEEIGELKAQLKSEQSEKDRLAGQGKQLFVEITNLKNEKKNFSDKNNELQNEVAQFKANLKRQEEAFQDRINKLEESRNSLEDERKRIRREDEERQAQKIAERDRIWNEHEVKVVAQLLDLCNTPELNFKSYDNNNLPEGFDGKFKPDFMIDFLGEYLIFDAKSSRSENLNVYIADQVKKTASKAAKATNIAKTIFLVVPTAAITEIKKLHFFEQGYSFYIISPEAIPAILASLKKIESYEFADQMTPQERENIVNLISELDQHISFSNTIQVLLAQRGVKSLSKLREIDPEMLNEIDQKKSKTRLKNFTPTDLKELMSSTHSQQQAIKELVDPEAPVSKQV